MNEIDFTIAINTFHDQLIDKTEILTTIEQQFLRKFEHRVLLPQHHSQMIYQIRRIISTIQQMYKDIKGYFQQIGMSVLYEFIRKIQTLMIVGYNHLSQALLVVYDQWEVEKNLREGSYDCFDGNNNNGQWKCNVCGSQIISNDKKSNNNVSNNHLNKLSHKRLQKINYTINTIQQQQTRLTQQMQPIYYQIQAQKHLVQKLKPSLATKQLQQMKQHMQLIMEENQRLFEETRRMRVVDVERLFRNIQRPQQMQVVCERVGSNFKRNFIRQAVKVAEMIQKARRYNNQMMVSVEVQTTTDRELLVGNNNNNNNNIKGNNKNNNSPSSRMKQTTSFLGEFSSKPTTTTNNNNPTNQSLLSRQRKLNQKLNTQINHLHKQNILLTEQLAKCKQAQHEIQVKYKELQERFVTLGEMYNKVKEEVQGYREKINVEVNECGSNGKCQGIQNINDSEFNHENVDMINEGNSKDSKSTKNTSSQTDRVLINNCLVSSSQLKQSNNQNITNTKNNLQQQTPPTHQQTQTQDEFIYAELTQEQLYKQLKLRNDKAIILMNEKDRKIRELNGKLVGVQSDMREVSKDVRRLIGVVGVVGGGGDNIEGYDDNNDNNNIVQKTDNVDRNIILSLQPKLTPAQINKYINQIIAKFNKLQQQNQQYKTQIDDNIYLRQQQQQQQQQRISLNNNKTIIIVNNNNNNNNNYKLFAQKQQQQKSHQQQQQQQQPQSLSQKHEHQHNRVSSSFVTQKSSQSINYSRENKKIKRMSMFNIINSSNNGNGGGNNNKSIYANVNVNVNSKDNVNANMMVDEHVQTDDNDANYNNNLVVRQASVQTILFNKIQSQKYDHNTNSNNKIYNTTNANNKRPYSLLNNSNNNKHYKNRSSCGDFNVNHFKKYIQHQQLPIPNNKINNNKSPPRPQIRLLDTIRYSQTFVENNHNNNNNDDIDMSGNVDACYYTYRRENNDKKNKNKVVNKGFNSFESIGMGIDNNNRNNSNSKNNNSNNNNNMWNLQQSHQRLVSDMPFVSSTLDLHNQVDIKNININNNNDNDNNQQVNHQDTCHNLSHSKNYSNNNTYLNNNNKKRINTKTQTNFYNCYHPNNNNNYRLSTTQQQEKFQQNDIVVTKNRTNPINITQQRRQQQQQQIKKKKTLLLSIQRYKTQSSQCATISDIILLKSLSKLGEKWGWDKVQKSIQQIRVKTKCKK